MCSRTTRGSSFGDPGRGERELPGRPGHCRCNRTTSTTSPASTTSSATPASPGAPAAGSFGPAQEWVNVDAEAKEVRDIEYDGNLEFFVEKTFAERFQWCASRRRSTWMPRRTRSRTRAQVSRARGPHTGHDHSINEESDPSYILTFRGTFAARAVGATRNPRCPGAADPGELCPRHALTGRDREGPPPAVPQARGPRGPQALPEPLPWWLQLLSSLPWRHCGTASRACSPSSWTTCSAPRHDIIDMQLKRFPERDDAGSAENAAAPSTNTPTPRSRSSRP